MKSHSTVTCLPKRSKAFKVRGKKMKLHRLAYSLTVSLSIMATVRGDSNPEKWKIAAAELLHSQNQSVNPCDDFYAHACSRQKGYFFFYTDAKIHEEISELLKNVPDDIEVLKKAAKFQDACADNGAIERRGLDPLKKILSDNGEWSETVPSGTRCNQYRSWQEMHENFAKNTGISALFDVTVEIERNNTGVHILTLGVPTVPSERLHIVARTKRETRSSQYRQYLAGVVEKLKESRGFDFQYDDLLADPEEVIRFEDELVKLTIHLDQDFTENTDDLRITTIETLQNDWDAVVPRISNYSINWVNIVKDRFKGTDIVVKASEKIALKPAAFVANLANLLKNTPVRTIVNYIHWKVIDNLLPGVYSEFWNPHAEPRTFPATDSGVCIVGHKMIHAVSYIYVKNYFNERSKTAVLEMVQNLQDEIKREIHESSWLDKATKLVVQKKIDAMRKVVGYPEWYDEPGEIEEYYRELEVGPDYFENILNYNKFEAKKQLSKLRSPVEETDIDWIASPFIVNAEYLQQQNALSIPAAIVQPPFFDFERPSVLNYGALGAIVGHEIGHGIDTHGRLYDEIGRKRKWWSQSAIDTYKTKAQCFVKQYDKYTVDIGNTTVHLNGTETQTENIADLIGFRAGLRAYRRLRNEGKTNNVKIQLLNNFTDEQLYFYALVNTFCEPGPIQKIDSGSMNSHSPKRPRIIGALSNMQEFADAFHCPLGSPMNPQEKCLVWD